MRTERMMLALAAVLLAGLAGAEVSAVSSDSPLDTRSISAGTDAEDQTLNSRSFDVDWSPPRKLSTKKIVGTIMLMR